MFARERVNGAMATRLATLIAPIVSGANRSDRWLSDMVLTPGIRVSMASGSRLHNCLGLVEIDFNSQFEGIKPDQWRGCLRCVGAVECNEVAIF
jgi:hypothetical protein